MIVGDFTTDPAQLHRHLGRIVVAMLAGEAGGHALALDDRGRIHWYAAGGPEDPAAAEAGGTCRVVADTPALAEHAAALAAVLGRPLPGPADADGWGFLAGLIIDGAMAGESGSLARAAAELGG